MEEDFGGEVVVEVEQEGDETGREEGVGARLKMKFAVEEGGGEVNRALTAGDLEVGEEERGGIRGEGSAEGDEAVVALLGGQGEPFVQKVLKPGSNFLIEKRVHYT